MLGTAEIYFAKFESDILTGREHFGDLHVDGR
jgi:hypothetical protein